MLASGNLGRRCRGCATTRFRGLCFVNGPTAGSRAAEPAGDAWDLRWTFEGRAKTLEPSSLQIRPSAMHVHVGLLRAKDAFLPTGSRRLGRLCNCHYFVVSNESILLVVDIVSLLLDSFSFLFFRPHLDRSRMSPLEADASPPKPTLWSLFRRSLVGWRRQGRDMPDSCLLYCRLHPRAS